MPRRDVRLSARTGIAVTIVLAVIGYAVATVIYFLDVEWRGVWCVVAALITLLFMRIVLWLSDRP
jgi:hypothetical protein